MTMTAMRWCRQKPTNASIIEQDSAPDYDLLARLHAGADDHLGALLEQWLDSAPLEGPGRGGDEYAGAIVVHEQRGAWQHNTRELRPVQRDAREHVGLEQRFRVVEGDARLVAVGVRLDLRRHRQHLAVQRLARLGIDSHLGILAGRD